MIVASFFAPRFEKWPGCDYDELLRLLDASCRRFGLRHIVISDQVRPAPLETACFDLPAPLMQAILDGQRQFLAATPGPVLLVGADCLIVKDPRPVLAGDLTITISPFVDSGINTGAIWCADGPACAPVWAAAVARKPVKWGEDQTALYAAIEDCSLGVGRVRAEDHNWAPESAVDDAGLPTVAHFRGRRKVFMADWAKRHLGIAA